jgi:hypothetical protein
MRALDLPIEIRRKMAPKISEHFFGPSPSVFVGHFGYPNVFAGPLGALEEREDIDDPSQWIKKDYADIIELRSLLIRSKKQQSVFSSGRFVRDIQDLSLAVNSPDIEVGFRKKPLLRMSFSQYSQPMGPAGTIKNFHVVENPKIPEFVGSVVGDEMKASDSAVSLYDKGLDVYKITTILSSGSLGINKKLVPTRWSITATDDIIAKSLLKGIREFRQLDGFQVFESFHLDNHFLIILMPGAWEFENFEAWSKGSYWSSGNRVSIEEEYEPFEGRKSYAEKQAGGYYASRLAISEHLHRIKKQASVLAIREIYEGYSVPLGVWQVRENVREAFKEDPKKFQNLDSAIKYASTRLRYPFSEYRKKSVLLNQSKLTNYC